MHIFSIGIFFLAICFGSCNIFKGSDWNSGTIPVGPEGNDLFYLLFKAKNLSPERNRTLIIWFNGGPGIFNIDNMQRCFIPFWDARGKNWAIRNIQQYRKTIHSLKSFYLE